MEQKYYKLSEYLLAHAENVANKRSAEHTRLVILATTARLLGKLDYHEIRVPDLCRSCEISRATFYLHFPTRDDLFVDLMRYLTELESSLTPSLETCADVSEGIARVVDWYIEVHLANTSLFLNLTFMRRTNLAINELWLTRARVLHRAVIDQLRRFPAFRALDGKAADFVLEFMGGGINNILSRVNTALPRNPYIPDDLSEIKAFISRIFYRSLFARDPEN
ncbi:MAG: hypothetical protein DCC73_09890 [Proteobacteria bacterium]|nr:MAG: hypothetical protein DCC73_09890 [Pseudomonadota bacterium]